MRDTIENVSQLQKQINDLQLENQILKAILDRSGIPYTQELNRRTAPETVERFDNAVTNFRSNLKTLGRNIPVFLICVVCFFAYITISYSVPYFCGLSLGNTSSDANFWDSVLLSNFHQMVTCIIPIPGNSVLSELFFLRLFYPASGPSFYSTEEIARASLLLWRSLMFIFPLFISCIFTLVYRPRKNIDNHDHQENQNPQE